MGRGRFGEKIEINGGQDRLASQTFGTVIMQAANDKLQEKLNQLNLKLSKLPPGFADAVNQPKTSKEKAKMDEEQEIINNITAKLEKHVPQQAIDNLNNDLASSKLNVQITPIDISPSQKFADNTAVLSNAINLLSGSLTGINFNPCLVSIDVAGISANIFGASFQPHLIDIEPAVSSLQAYGINLQPTILSVTPNGVQLGPGGVNVQPTLIAVAPVSSEHSVFTACAALLLAVNVLCKMTLEHSLGVCHADGGVDSAHRDQHYTKPCTGWIDWIQQQSCR